MQPLDIYSGLYVSFMLIMIWAVRNRPVLLSAMSVVFLEWFSLQLWHGVTDQIATIFIHTFVDFVAVWAFVRWVPKCREAQRAAVCFRGMLALHFLYALSLSFGLGFMAEFEYLTIYNGMGYLAMALIAGGAFKDELKRFAERLFGRGVPAFSFREPIDTRKRQK